MTPQCEITHGPTSLRRAALVHRFGQATKFGRPDLVIHASFQSASGWWLVYYGHFLEVGIRQAEARRQLESGALAKHVKAKLYLTKKS